MQLLRFYGTHCQAASLRVDQPEMPWEVSHTNKSERVDYEKGEGRSKMPLHKIHDPSKKGVNCLAAEISFVKRSRYHNDRSE